MTRILIPGRTCAALVPPRRAGLLVDGRDYYRAFYRAACRARRYLLISAWQLDSRVRLLRGEDAVGAPHPVELLPFLRSLCEQQPALEVYLLVWDASTLFALEREPLQSWTFSHGGQPRIHYRLDRCHPIGASHHQKFVVVDRALGFVGGMDLCASRWDDRSHDADDPRRRNPYGLAYGPYHDVQCAVSGPAVDLLTDWFADRWRCSTGETLALPAIEPRRIPFTPTLPLQAPLVGLARTLPRLGQTPDGADSAEAGPDAPPQRGAVEELRALHVAAIAAARRSIYIENQYFSSEDVRQALIERLRGPASPPLEVVIILPERTKALKERIAIGLRQAAILRELSAEAARNGHHFGAYYTVAPRAGGGDRSAGDDGSGDSSVYIHAKVLAIDDRFLLVSSANTTNRSMGLDTELGVAWEAARPSLSLRAARVELLREHTGLDPAGATRDLVPLEGLVARLDALAASGTGRLRLHRMEEGAERGDLIGRLLPDDIVFDPDGPLFEDALWQATDGDGDAGLLDRIAAAWRKLRDGVRGPANGERSVVDSEAEGA